MSWQPLLDGRCREEALGLAREIAVSLFDAPPCWVPAGADPDFTRVLSSTLGSGKAGIALALGYLARSSPADAEMAAAARRLALESSRIAGTDVMNTALFGGFTGFAWTLAKLDTWGLLSCDDETFAEIDQVLVEFLDRQPWPWQIDLINGLVGIAVYQLDRLPNPTARRALDLIVCDLESCAEETAEGITWFTTPNLLQPDSLRQAPNGYYNFGMAHGVPGIMSVLAQVIEAGVAEERAARLLTGAVRWLLAGELAPGGNFPYMTGPEVRVKPARVGWCYGTPGIAVAVDQAASALGRDDWRREAVRIAHWAAARTLDESGVEDAAFCHGAAGLAHVFNRLHQRWGDERLREAARVWIGRIFDQRVPGEGVAGFRIRNPDPEAAEPWFGEPGILTGAAGVAAVLTAAASEVPPDWDRMFLLGGRAGDA